MFLPVKAMRIHWGRCGKLEKKKKIHTKEWQMQAAERRNKVLYLDCNVL